MKGFSLTERARLLIRTHSLKSVKTWLATMYVLNLATPLIPTVDRK